MNYKVNLLTYGPVLGKTKRAKRGVSIAIMSKWKKQQQQQQQQQREKMHMIDVATPADRNVMQKEQKRN